MSKIIDAAKPTGAAVLLATGARVGAVRRLFAVGKIRYRMSSIYIAVSLPGVPLPTWEQIADVLPTLRASDIVGVTPTYQEEV